MIWKFFSNSKFVFPLAVVFGFLFSGVAKEIDFILLPVLMAMMTLSIKDVALHHIGRHDRKRILWLVLLNYVLLTGLTVFGAILLIDNPIYQKGYLVLAIMPPAVGILSLSYLLKGKMDLGFVAEFVSYGLSIVLVPILAFILFGDAVSPVNIIRTIIMIIVVPFLISRIIHYLELHFKPIPKIINKSMINLFYSTSFFIIIGLNVDKIFSDYQMVMSVVLLSVVLKFVLSVLIYNFARGFERRSVDVLYVLFGTMKNGGAGTAIAIMLFGLESTVPLAVHAMFVPFFIIFLEYFIPHGESVKRE